MKGGRTVLWITRTAILLALLVVVQAATALLGNTLVTGSLVNLLLIVSAMVSGLYSGLAVAAVSPAMAKLLGIGPLWSLIPFIMAGNVVLVLLWHFIGNGKRGRPVVRNASALAAAAVAKFLVLYIGIARVAVPFLLELPQAQATTISGMFSLPQLATAAIGGALAMAVLPPLQKAVKAMA